MRAVIACLAGLAPLLFAATATAGETCEERVRSWADECPSLREQCVEPRLCPPGRAIVRVGCSDEARLEVELTPATPRAFRAAGALSLAPVGEFADFAREPPSRRRAFEALVECAARGANPLVAREAKVTSGVLAPWRLLAGGLIGVAAALSAARARSARGRELLGLVLLCLGTLLGRALLAPAEFFHQNGQGPSWIALALSPTGALSHYGPGYFELFHGLTRSFSEAPEAIVFGAHAVCGASIPGLTWITLRSAGSSRPFAWAGAAALATSPLLARLFQSESYYATNGFVLWFSCAVLAVTARFGRLREVVLGSLGTGLLVSQAARTLPVGWVALAALPLAVLAARRTGDRFGAFAASAGLIGIVVGATTGSTLLAVADGYLGRTWLPQARALSLTLPCFGLLALPVALGLLGWSGDRRRALPAALGLVAVAAAAELTCLVRDERGTVVRAYLSLWAPVTLALLGMLEGALPADGWRRRVPAGLLVAVLTLVHATTATADLSLTTDAAELRWSRSWRRRLEPDARVLFLGATARGVLDLPLYERDGSSPRTQSLTAGQALPPAPRSGIAYYYRSSLCSTADGAETCARVEREYRLLPLEARELAARPSTAAVPYTTNTVRIGLFRIETDSKAAP